MPLEDWNNFQQNSSQSLELVMQVRIQDAAVY
jgi:hypothetical protein